MSDLISRSELLKELKSLKIVLSGKQIFSDDAKDTVLRIVNEQQIAYDIDKVVEELEIDSSVKPYGSGNFLIPVGRAIEIVKQGCVSDDVCEWKHSERFRGMETLKTGCCGKTMILTALEAGDIECSTQYAMKYCPYCRKGIKVKK